MPQKFLTNMSKSQEQANHYSNTNDGSNKQDDKYYGQSLKALLVCNKTSVSSQPSQV